MAQRSPVGDVHGPWNRTSLRAGRIVVGGTTEEEQGGGGAAGEDALGTRSAKEGKEGGRKEEERLGRPRDHPLSQCHLSRRVSHEATAQRRGEGGGDGAWVAVHRRPSPPYM